VPHPLAEARRRSWWAAVVLILAGAGAAPLLLSTQAAAPAPAHRMSPRPTLAATVVKPQIKGLIDKGSQAPYTHGRPFPPVNLSEVKRDAAAFSGIVVNETWAQLEPTSGNFTFGPLRSSLAAVKAYNRAHPKHRLLVELRIFGGFGAPGWAKMMDGSPITIQTKILHSGAGTVGQWWKPDYRGAWSALQHTLAASFDGNPLIRSIAISSCATLTAEPFVISLVSSVRKQLVADGWSWTAEQQCLDGAFADYSGWTHTSIDYAFNPFPARAAGAASSHTRMSITAEVMSRCASLLSTSGRSCALSNHALDQHAATTSRTAPVYSEINRLYSQHHGRVKVDFQTLTHNNFGGCRAIAVAVRHHARSVELWPPTPNFRGYAAQPQQALVSWAQALRQGKAPSC